jgi:hypothetical protein
LIRRILGKPEFPSRPSTDRSVGHQTCLHSQAAGQGDHRAIVGAKLRPWKIQLRPAVAADLEQPRAQLQIGSHTPGDDQASMAREPQRTPTFFSQGRDDRLLKTARNIGTQLLARFAAAQGY